jgi:peptidoglycan/xylan/chitin deacetylase (PgdA/CDA1 family)
MINLILALLVVYHIYMLPEYLLDFILKDKNIYYKTTSTYLFTFDDSPTPYTASILDWLQQNKLKAVFFVLADRVDGNEAMLDRIVREGHTVGNHGCKDRVHAFLDGPTFEEELKKSDRILQPWIGQASTKWFRSGFGFFNTTILNLLADYDYTLMLGNIYSYDSIVTNPDMNAWYIQRKLNAESIVILHDNDRSLPTLQRLSL